MGNPLEHMPLDELENQVFHTEFLIASSTEYLQELTKELVARNVQITEKEMRGF